jgi:hypothetical protein
MRAGEQNGHDSTQCLSDQCAVVDVVNAGAACPSVCCVCVLVTSCHLQFKMLRDIEGQQFSDAVRDKLGPRVAVMGECHATTNTP